MRSKLKTVDNNSSKNRFHDWIFVRLLLIFERGIFWLLYAISMMESDEVFVNEEPKPRSPNSPGKNYREFKTLTSDHKDRTRAISVPHMPPTAKNPVKDFISHFVNRKGAKKRASLKRSVTTENVTDEKAAVRYVGRGHSFVSCHLRNPTWCDCCGEFIWGLFKQCVRCKNCKYTCHRRCRDDVDLDCTGGWQFERNLSVDEMTMKTLHLIDQGEKRKEPFMLYTDSPTGSLLRKKIDEFNSSTTGLIMTMRNEDTYQGFIRVHMNLVRPINIIAGERPLSIFETVGVQREEDQKSPQRTSFFLPLGTVKALHITSETTVHEVIVALLKKFKVADNPRKFALFECYQEEDKHMILRRMSDFEQPLVLRLLWGGGDIRHNFSLQENETGDIVWEVFSIPELQNFMKILDREEEEHITQVEEKYRVYKERLEQALALLEGKTAVNSSPVEEKPPLDESSETSDQ
ncbi:ras association domain-containing protein 1-like isoform X1 [Orbicella faveolata]|uniref:ras association domain-containing protein 1-like isoform X1 n=2 Tax=Orbicella faveolata TaxID=48498 RepID=UPI0009E476E8|nr:ras association domain-containing protein 1-like isoform X1 [Orbicella faveolata]